jgi:hypothetical protein
MAEGAIGIAPEIHDLCASKLVAFREKDLAYVGAAVEAGLVEPATLLTRVAEIDAVPQAVRARASAWISREREAR